MTTNGPVDTWELEKAYRAVVELQAVAQVYCVCKSRLEQLFVRSSYLPTVLLAVGVDAVKTRSELAVLDQTPELFQINFIVTVKFLGRKEPRVNGLCRFRAFLAHVITAKAYDTTR